MLQSVYGILTSHVGMYLGYVIPIGYFLIIVAKSVALRMKKQEGVGAKGLAAIAAIAVITLDFIRFVYLFFSGTGVLMPPGMLFVKYALGFLMWLWVLWYSFDLRYEVHFSRRTAE